MRIVVRLDLRSDPERMADLVFLSITVGGFALLFAVVRAVAS
ncbi:MULTISPECIES: hypothetical protein [unclassified Rhodococcus (in: high G+C Gram-positive bacteria)]|nr:MULTISPECIES: hypothetical protein [unclassified Rhodococcus (in: high G+C Gram-positive bacteria)]